MGLPLTPQEWTKMVQVAPGVVVERDVLAVVDWIRDYDPNLDVLYLDPNRFDLSPSDPPYKVIEHCRDGMDRVVFSCWTLDNTVKERIIAADTQNQDVLAVIAKEEQKFKDKQRAMFMEGLGEAHDQTVHLLKNPKTTYRFRNNEGDLVTVEDDKGVVKRATD